MAATPAAIIWLITACTVGAVLTPDKKPEEKSHVVARSYSSFERRISTVAVPPPPPPPFYERRPPPALPSRRHRPHAAPVPPYAVHMEPLVQYSQFDPLFHHHRQEVDGKLSDTSTHNDLKDIKKSSFSTPSLPADHSHKSNQHSSSSDAGSASDHEIASSDVLPAYPDSINQQIPYHSISPYYLKEPEPIIEIIIQESNVSLPAPPTLPPKPPTREPIQVFYVKYKKDPTKVGKDGEESLIYEEPIPAVTPPTTSHLEETPLPPEHHHPTPSPPPPPSTTLRTIIHPDSELYYGDSSIRVTFGTPHDGPEQQEQEQSAPQPAVALPTQQAEQRQGVNFPTFNHKKHPEAFQSPPGARNIPFQGQVHHSHVQFQRSPQQPSFFPSGPQARPSQTPNPASHNLRSQQHFNQQQPTNVPRNFFGTPQEQRLSHQQFPPPPLPPQQVHGIQHQQRLSQERPRFQHQLAQAAPLGHSNNFPSRPTFPSTHFPVPLPSQQRPQPEQQYTAQQQFRNQQQNVPQPQHLQQHQLHQQQLHQQQFSQQQSRNTPQHSLSQQQNRGLGQQQQLQPSQQQQQRQQAQQHQFQQQQIYQQQQQVLNQRDQLQKQLQELQQQRLQNLQQHQRQELQKQTQGPNQQRNNNQFHNINQQTLGKPNFPIDPNAFRGELIKSLPKYEEHIVESTPTSIPRPNFQTPNQLAQLHSRPNNNFNNANQLQQPTEQVNYRQLPSTSHNISPLRQQQNQATTPATISATNGYRPFPSVAPTQSPSTERPLTEGRNDSKEHHGAPDPATLAALPDEVPEDLRQQLIASGVLSNADIQVLDYDKIGDIPIDKLPPEALANFYNAGGSSAAASAPIPAVVSPNTTRDPVQMKVVRYNPETPQGQAIEDEYVKDDATQLEPVVLNDSGYNRYLPLKVSGAQFPVPDVAELRGRNVTSVVVLAPVTYQFDDGNASSSAEAREGREAPAEVQGVRFLSGDTLRAVVKHPSADNYRRWLRKENNTATDMQSIILLVSQPQTPGSSSKEIFMYDVSTSGVSRLKGELSAAFVEVAEENAQADELETMETMRMERRQPQGASISSSYSKTAATGSASP